MCRVVNQNIEMWDQAEELNFMSNFVADLQVDRGRPCR
jgi:hypothetical protein